jgi:hypothetical protein
MVERANFRQSNFWGFFVNLCGVNRSVFFLPTLFDLIKKNLFHFTFSFMLPNPSVLFSLDPLCLQHDCGRSGHPAAGGLHTRSTGSRRPEQARPATSAMPATVVMFTTQSSAR